MLFDVKTETFLFEYFLYDSIIGKYTDNEKMFYCLGEIWNLDYNNLEDLFKITESENVKEISTESEYMRYRRIKQYNTMIGRPEICSGDENTIIAIKGDAMRVVAQYAMQSTKETTKSVMYKTLIKNAQSGNILALRVLGILECEGILGDINLELGLDYLYKATRWADITATLALLKYSPSDRQETINILKSATKDTVYTFLMSDVKKMYGISANKYNEDVLLLRKTFDVKKSKADSYNSMYARLIFSPILKTKDKEKILFSERKELLSEACDLPLHLTDKTVQISNEIFSELVLKREEEQEDIKTALDDSIFCSMDSYRPVCISSDSDYLLDTYASKITNGFLDANVERINVSELREFDFEPTKNNVFIRALSENKPNVLLLVFKGEINDRAIELTKSIICTSMRSKYRLTTPSVTLNLGCVLPVCIADKFNSKKLNGIVDMIYLENLNEKEKLVVISDIVEKKSKHYNVKHVSIDEIALKKLIKIPMESAEKIIDKVVREHRMKNSEFNLTIDLLKPYLTKISNNNYGFGGVINEG